MTQVPAPGPQEPGAPPQSDDAPPLPGDAPDSGASPASAATRGDADADAEERERARERMDTVIGLVIVAVGFCVALMISWWSMMEAQPETSEPPAPPTSAGVSGFPDKVDPLATLARARSLTERDLLRGITIHGASAAGTVDVSNGSGQISYVFQDAAGEGAQPPRNAGTLARRHYCGSQTVGITSQGIGAEPDDSAKPCPSVPVEPLPDPRCGPRELWALASRKGAPPDRYARMEYYRSRGGPAWRFDMTEPSVSLRVSGDCGRELTAAEARVVPY